MSIRFSKHAAGRMNERGIAVTQDMLARLDKATVKAGSKGVKNVVMLGDGNAFLVNVPNKTVITAVPEQDMKENVFTNIDGAILI